MVRFVQPHAYADRPRHVLSPDDWHTLLGEAWNICDNIGAHRNLLRRMLPPSGPVRQMMNADEPAAYDALPRAADRLSRPRLRSELEGRKLELAP